MAGAADPTAGARSWAGRGPAGAPGGDEHDAELSGLDALEAVGVATPGRAAAVWAAAWPKLAAVALAVASWQVVVWTRWRSESVLPSPFSVMDRLGAELARAVTWQAIGTTLARAGRGFAVSAVLGVVAGLAVARWRTVRAGVGSLISGMQTMPSIAWFPLALLLFRAGEGAITFVVVLGAAPAIANGVITGIDHVPPLLARAGRALGARGLAAYRHVIVPAALPSCVAGLKQGWAFAWRSLMAGELMVAIAGKPSIGARLSFERDANDAAGLMAWMLVILAIGILVDAVGFATIERSLRRRRGLGYG